MKRCGVILLTVLLVLLNGCARYTDRSQSADLSLQVEDCAAPVKDGHGIVLENDNTIQPYRPHYGLGTCHVLEGEQTVVAFFVDDDESAWTAEDIVDFTDEKLLPGLEFLQEQAEQWGVELSFTVKRYSTLLSEGPDMRYTGKVNKDLYTGNGSTKDLVEQVGALYGFDTGLEFLAALVEEHENERIIPLMFINKDGTAYARNQLSEQIVDHAEHAVIFADGLGDPSGSWRYIQRRGATIAHEILHLFGAEDYYLDPERQRLAEEYYIQDIMLLDTFRLSQLKVDKATAYYVGWTDEVPEVCYNEKWFAEDGAQ